MLRRATVATLLLVLSQHLPAQGWIIPRPCGVGILPATATPPIAAPRPCVSSIARTASSVKAELADRVVRYEVDERFINRGGAIGEADYIFPLPNGAAFQDLKLSINGEMVSGETMNAADARRIYENIVRTQRDPALVEWIGRGLVRARIFPINPGEEKRVVIRFQSVAQREGDALRLDYTRGLAQRTTVGEDAAATSFELDYDLRPELGTPYSPTHQLDVTDHDYRRRVTVRGDARDLTLLVPMRRSTTAAISMLPYAPGNEDGFALITVTPPVMQRGEQTPRDVTLVLDVSGSMAGRKIEQARAAGRQLLATLRPDDRFRLIDFSSDVRCFRDDFVPASAANVREATHYLDALEAVGGTNIEGALREATRAPTTRGRLPLVLFVTDGEPTIGEHSPDRLAELAQSAASGTDNPRRIFTFGLGSDVNVSLLEQLALEGRGTPQFVRPDESVERMVGVVAARLVDPVLTDVHVRIDGDVRLSRMLPAQQSDIFADRDLVLFARYSGHGPAKVVVDGQRRGAPVHWESTVNFPDRSRDNPFVARLWATQRVGFLSAEKRRGGDPSELDSEIKSLGERYGIPTEFTSYLVVEPRLARAGAAGGTARLNSVSPAAFAPAAERDARFEQAKAAAAQRSVVNMAAVDSLASTANPGTRRIGERTFALRDGRWTDQRYDAKIQTTRIKPFSKAYFDLLASLPELRAPFALGDRVVVMGRTRAIELTEDGASTLNVADLDAIVRGW